MTFFGNVGRLVETNYEILFDEARGEGVVSRAIVLLVFVVCPAFAGVLYGLTTPEWHFFAEEFLQVIATLTGFAIVSLVVLHSFPTTSANRADDADVSRLSTVLAYLILVGICYIAVGLFEITFFESANGLDSTDVVRWAVYQLELPAITSYILLAHYLLFVLVLVGRLYRLNVEDGIDDVTTDGGGT